tara:strand:- start:222 stop:1877 length:1656 start_codon:yes stop_codon:yes gene_type:complete
MTLATVSSRTKIISNALVADMKATFAVSRTLERQSLELKRKLVKERRVAYAALASRGRGTDKGFGAGDGLLGGALGIRGLRMARRFLGGGGGTVTRGRGGGPKFPRLPGRGPRITGGGRFRLPRLGGGARITGGGNALRGARVGPLAVAFTALDFGTRLADGQNLTQATVGAGGGLAGALAGGATGAKIGAAIGTFFGPGIGTAIGGAIGFAGGSIIGGMAGSGIADFLTGANRRREFETKRTIALTAKTSFSEAQDKFDRVLDKFAKLARKGIFLGMIEDDDDEVGPEIDDIIPIGRKPRWKGWVDNVGYTALGIGLAALAVVGLVNLFDGPWSETFLGLAAKQAFLKAPWLKRLSFIKRTTPKVYVRPPVTVSGQQPTKTLSDIILDANRVIKKKFPNNNSSTLRSLGSANKTDLSVRTRVQLENTMNPLRKRLPDEDLIKRILEAGSTVDDFWGTPKIPGKQDGGEVSAGEPIVVGEIEPELFIPGQDGVIVPGSGRQKVLVINNGGTIQKVPIGVGGGGGSSTPMPVTTDVYSNLAKYAQFTSLLTV